MYGMGGGETPIAWQCGAARNNVPCLHFLLSLPKDKIKCRQRMHVNHNSPQRTIIGESDPRSHCSVR